MKKFLKQFGFVIQLSIFCGVGEIAIWVGLIYQFWNLPSAFFIIVPVYLILGSLQSAYGHLVFKTSNWVQLMMHEGVKAWFSGQSKMIFTNEKVETMLNEKSINRLLVGSHPHGFIPVQTGLHGFLYPLFRKINSIGLTHKLVLMWPFSGIYYRWLGMASISNTNFIRLMSKKGEKKVPLVIVPGGGDEMVWTRPHEHTLYLKNRKGFVKYCLQYGYSMLPIFHFGVTELYSISFLAKYLPKKTSDKKVGFLLKWVYLYFQSFFLIGSALFCRGWNFIFFYIPKKKPIYSFAGDLIEVPEPIKKPSREEVSKYHQMYLDNLVKTREMGIKIMQENPKDFPDVSYGELQII